MSTVRVRATLDMTIDMPDVIAQGPHFWSWADKYAADRFARDRVASKLLELASSGAASYYTANDSFNVGYHKLKEERSASN